MIRVETHAYETPTMRKFRFEKELEELEAIDPTLAQQHYEEVYAYQAKEFAKAVRGLLFWGAVLVLWIYMVLS